MQSFGATIKFDLHFCAFNGIAQTNLVAFSMKMSRACPSMLSSKMMISNSLQLQKKLLEDLKVLRRSPDLLNNVKIGQG